MNGEPLPGAVPTGIDPLAQLVDERVLANSVADLAHQTDDDHEED